MTLTLELFKTLPGRPELLHLPTRCYRLLRGGEQVGTLELRVGKNEATLWSGNVAYTVFPPHRGRGYAAQGCRLLLEEARTLGMGELLITCSPENLASQKTCLALGAQDLGEEEVPPWHELRKSGKRRVRRFLVKIIETK